MYAHGLASAASLCAKCRVPSAERAAALRPRSPPPPWQVCDELARLLRSGVRAILVSERSEQTPALGMMESRGVDVVRLIDQSLGKDDRQSLLLSAEASPLPRPSPPRSSDAELTFTNVPFEEHKIKRGGAAGAGGSQTRWYS